MTGRSKFPFGENFCNCKRCQEVREIGGYEVTQGMSLPEFGLIVLGIIVFAFAASFIGLWLLDLI